MAVEIRLVGRWSVLCVFVAVTCVVHHATSYELYSPEELYVENGTDAKLPCTFKSTEVTSSSTSATWSFVPESGGSSITIFHYTNGKSYPGNNGPFKDRITWAGDINKKDVSIKVEKMHFRDNGTYICNIVNPPDVSGSPRQIKLRVVEKENLPASNVPFLVAVICGVIGGLLLLAIFIFAVCICQRRRPRKFPSGIGSPKESLVPSVKQPPRKSPPESEALVNQVPSGTLQGPVIYAQLDHSGKPGSQINKSEMVVYADIRKNC
ncbi:myelin protein zero-like protein 1 [Discoglossus pictus]